jgi:manganese/zinc/iron transport system substrate-binding protein
MQNVLQQLGQRKPVIAVGAQVTADHLLDSEDYEDEHDPHIWFDVQLWMQAVDHGARHAD